jgi:hypothetical protein
MGAEPNIRRRCHKCSRARRQGGLLVSMHCKQQTCICCWGWHAHQATNAAIHSRCLDTVDKLSNSHSLRERDSRASASSTCTHACALIPANTLASRRRRVCSSCDSCVCLEINNKVLFRRQHQEPNTCIHCLFPAQCSCHQARAHPHNAVEHTLGMASHFLVALQTRLHLDDRAFAKKAGH